ncbi:MAG: hypothetical protein OXH00_26050 [Candidatus Poribacteria bacterium]|nr:hypothetical protein [Candidatus Poribacteria bacterium]
MLDFEIIQRVTQAEDIDLSINLENQVVVVAGTHGRTKRVKRTVYRARFEGETLIGNIHQRNSKDNPWPVYMFNPQRHHWVPREVMKMQTERLTKEQRIHRSEQRRERK